MKHSLRVAAALALSWSSGAASAKTYYRDLHDFMGQSADGDTPYSDLVADSQGRLYGTTYYGGSFNNGTVFRVTLPATKTGPATTTILYSFQSAEGKNPLGGVLIGADGGLYGTTSAGGAHNAGTVYRLDPASFSVTDLHDFNPDATPADGGTPHAGLVAGPNGLLYGTTSSNGPLGGGTVFAISPKGDSVAYGIIHALGGPGDGNDPLSGRLTVMGRNLFGTTIFGGGFNSFGTVFELTLATNGTWSESGLYQFGVSGPDAIFPANGLALASSGVLYGCAQGGAGGANGAVYAITPGTGGAPLTEALIYSFVGSPGAPADAGACALTADKSGRLVGTSSGGGTNGTGTLFTLTPGGGSWTLAVPYSFGVRADGAAVNPASPVIGVANGSYVGTTPAGGAGGKGAVYGIKP